MTHHTWLAPFTCVISGPTGSGKSVFVQRLIKHVRSVISPSPDKILYCYGAYQEMFSKIEGVEFNEGLPSLDEFNGSKRSLVIIDDLMHETNNVVSKLFTKVSHHANVSVIYITQNIFNPNKETRTITLNAQYLVLFKNVRDKSQIAYLARQMYPSSSKHMVEAYNDATSEPYSYLFIDLKPNVDEKQRLKACIFPDDMYNYVYVRK
jgi:DNA replication protein DnaC